MTEMELVPVTFISLKCEKKMSNAAGEEDREGRVN